MTERITDQLTETVVSTMRQALNGDMDSGTAARLIREAQEKAERLRIERTAAFYGVPVAGITDAELAEAIIGTEKSS